MRHIRPLHAASSPQRPYNLSILAIFRNEAHVIREWIEHYLAVGFEHFYLIDNNSDDGYRAELESYLCRGVVDLFHCEKDNYQIGAYSELLAKIAQESRWIATFDLDEFVYAPGGQSFAAILERFSGFEAVLIPWLSFGSSGHVLQPTSVVDGFTRRGRADVCRSFLKSISRPTEIIEFKQHNPVTRLGRKVLADGTPFGDGSFIHLEECRLGDFALVNNHYRLQSQSWFLDVKTRRPEVHENTVGIRKELSFFEANDQYWNSVLDTRLCELRRNGYRSR